MFKEYDLSGGKYNNVHENPPRNSGIHCSKIDRAVPGPPMEVFERCSILYEAVPISTCVTCVWVAKETFVKISSRNSSVRSLGFIVISASNTGFTGSMFPANPVICRGTT